MKRTLLLRIAGAGVFGLVLAAWMGTAVAAEWANPGLLLNADQVKANLGKSDWVVLDCRGLSDYLKGHIEGAISLGDSCSKALRDSTSRLHRDPSWYEDRLGKAGIGNDTHVVVYHGNLRTITSATVAFWTLEYLGHDKVHLLDGGLEAWSGAGNRLVAEPTIKPATTFKANVQHSRYAETAEILEIANGQAANTQLIDSRTVGEFEGTNIKALRGGHVPNATINVSHVDTLKQVKDAKTGKTVASGFLDVDQVSGKFASLDRSKRTIGYCQTGTRSTLTYLELRLLGFEDPANWDESWRVYGSQVTYPIDNPQWINFSSYAAIGGKISALAAKVKKLEDAAK